MRTMMNKIRRHLKIALAILTLGIGVAACTETVGWPDWVIFEESAQQIGALVVREDRNMQINARLTVNQQGTQDALRVQDNGTDVFTVADGGSITSTNGITISGVGLSVDTIKKQASAGVSFSDPLTATKGVTITAGGLSLAGGGQSVTGGLSGDYITSTNTISAGTSASIANGFTVSAGSVTLPAGSVANAALAAGNSYFTIACKHEGQETATLDPMCTFQMPFAATLVEISGAARDIDTANADETYVVDVEEAGTTVMATGAVTITADNTVALGTLSDTAVADNAKMEVLVTIGGTTPTIDDLFVLLTFKVAHTN